MNLNQLKYFVAVAEQQSFTKAAAQLFVTQPMLTRSIKHLEEELNVLLIERTSKSFYLTDAGRIEAGVPYLVKPLASATEMTLHDAAVTSTESTKTTIDGVNFIGTYSPTTIRSGEFFIADDMFYLADTDVSVKGYRAYITLDSNPANQVNRLRISIDGVPTGVEAILGDAAGAEKTVDVYTLNGMKMKSHVRKSQALDGLPKGIYIVGGQKTVNP